MSTYYLLPGNLAIGPVQTLPTDVKHKIQQNINGVNAAEKAQDLNTVLLDSDAQANINASIVTTVAQVLAPYTDTTSYPSPTTKNIPAYKIHVSGWADQPITEETGHLYVVGGFPRSYSSAQNVDASKATSVQPFGTMTLFTPAAMPGDSSPSETYILSNTDITLSDIPLTDFPSWAVKLDTPYVSGDNLLKFDFTFFLYVM